MVRLNGGGKCPRSALRSHDVFAILALLTLPPYLWGEGAKILAQEELDPVLPTSRLLRNPLVS